MHNYGYTFKTMCINPLTQNYLLNFEPKHSYKGSVAESQKSFFIIVLTKYCVLNLVLLTVILCLFITPVHTVTMR